MRNATLLNEIIVPEDIANACYVFVGGLINKATGNVLNVDGGVAMAFVEISMLFYLRKKRSS